jgi:WD40 repeat protein
MNKQNRKEKSDKKKEDYVIKNNENQNEIYVISNDDNNLNINNNINNNLSDLDQDEYFLKNCYDYYNYDIKSLSLKKVIEDTHPIRCCCFNPKGEYFAIGTNSKCLKIYDLSYILESFTKRNNIYAQLNSNNNTTHMLSNSKLNKEAIGMIFELKNHHHGSIFCIDWSSSGKLIATGSNDKMIKLLSIPQLEEKNKNIIEPDQIFELQITGNQGTVRSLCFEPANDLVLLSANSGENTIKIWDTLKGINIECLEGHNSDVNSVKWSNDSQLFASCGLDKTVRFWDIREYKNTNILSAIQYADINDISIFAKGHNIIVAVGHTDGLVTIWDYSKQCVIKEIYEHNEEVRAVSFSPDGKYLLSGSFDSKIKIYDINNNFMNIGELEHGDKVVSCKWHPEIPLIVSTSADKTARVWVPSKF